MHNNECMHVPIFGEITWLKWILSKNYIVGSSFYEVFNDIDMIRVSKT